MSSTPELPEFPSYYFQPPNTPGKHMYPEDVRNMPIGFQYGNVPPRKPGGLGIMNDHYVRERAGVLQYTDVRWTEGWGLAAGSYIYDKLPRDPRKLTSIAVKASVLARSLITRRMLPMAAVTELLTVLTPLPGDEVLNGAVMTGLAIKGLSSVVHERQKLRGRA